MVTDNLIKNKSFNFALSMIELYKMLKVENGGGYWTRDYMAVRHECLFAHPLLWLLV